MSDNHDDYEDIVLSELDDSELVEQMHEDLYDGLAEEIAEGTQILLDRGWEATKVLDEALVEGMVVVGDDFRDGILFVPRSSSGCQCHESWHGFVGTNLVSIGSRANCHNGYWNR